MKKIYFLFFAILVAVLWQCDEIKDWSDSKDSTPPGKVTNASVKNVNGGAEITYQLPGDNDILGVKAVYYFSEETEKREMFSSAYNDTIYLEGFPDTKERTVQLICIDKSMNESEPVEVKINPLTPPVELVRQSLKVNTTFGGVYAHWSNEYNADVALSLFAEDSLGNMIYDNAHYSKLSEGGYTFRGFDDKERKFRIEISDRWENHAAPFDTILTPLYEEEIKPYNEFGTRVWQRYGFTDMTTTWRGDIVYDHPNGQNPWTHAIDGVTLNRTNMWLTHNSGNRLSFWVDDIVSGSDDDKDMFPLYVIFDFGQEVSLSRHKLWHRGRNPGEGYLLSTHRYYQQGAPKYYEVWGCKDTPKQPEDFANKMESLAYWTEWPEVGGTDSWKNDWIKLGDATCLPPSGGNPLTVDDIIFADEGFEMNVYPEATGEKIRYIRFVFKELWYDQAILVMAEFKFYGAY